MELGITTVTVWMNCYVERIGIRLGPGVPAYPRFPAVGNGINRETADYRIVGQSGVGGAGLLSKRTGDLDSDGFDDVMISSNGD